MRRLALIVVVASVAAACTSRSGTPSTATSAQGPAKQPITQASPGTLQLAPANASSLRLAWQARTGPARKGSTVAMADGMVLVQADDLYAFPQGCESDGATCRPAWVGRLPSTGGFSTGASPEGPAVGGGMVYVAARDLYAFSTSCAGGGGTCRATWVGNVGPGYANQPVVAGSSVYVGTGKGKSSGRLYAFPTNCGTAGGKCDPTWVSRPQPDPLLVTSVADGVVYATSWGNPRGTTGNKIYAFSTHCTNGCEPEWVGSIRGYKGVSIAVGGGTLFVGATKDTPTAKDPYSIRFAIRAYPEDCGLRPRCRPLWTTEGAGGAGIPPIVYADGVVYSGGAANAYAADSGELLWSVCCETHGISYQTPVVADGLIWETSGSGTAAYPLECGTGGASCDPTWTSLEGEQYGLYHVSKAGLAVSDSMVVRVTKAMEPYASRGHWMVYAFALAPPAS